MGQPKSREGQFHPLPPPVSLSKGLASALSFLFGRNAAVALARDPGLAPGTMLSGSAQIPLPNQVSKRRSWPRAVRVGVSVRTCVCVRARVRACVRACARVRACVRA